MSKQKFICSFNFQKKGKIKVFYFHLFLNQIRNQPCYHKELSLLCGMRKIKVTSLKYSFLKKPRTALDFK